MLAAVAGRRGCAGHGAGACGAGPAGRPVRVPWPVGRRCGCVAVGGCLVPAVGRESGGRGRRCRLSRAGPCRALWWRVGYGVRCGGWWSFAGCLRPWPLRWPPGGGVAGPVVPSGGSGAAAGGRGDRAPGEVTHVTSSHAWREGVSVSLSLHVSPARKLLCGSGLSVFLPPWWGGRPGRVRCPDVADGSWWPGARPRSSSCAGVPCVRGPVRCRCVRFPSLCLLVLSVRPCGRRSGRRFAVAVGRGPRAVGADGRGVPGGAAALTALAWSAVSVAWAPLP